MTENREGEGVIVHSPDIRAQLYNVALALIPILVAAGLIAQEQAQLWLALIAAVLGLGAAILARVNVPKGRHVREP